MTDYGHDLAFGTFITPASADPQVPVRLAQLSEDAGLDLVTFQDHPYNPGFLDTWTLLSWVAARTTRINVSGNVLNLALRPPAVLAKSAASLDLLSGGRFALGLGTGGFWDAIEAMGAPRLTPGQAVDALIEALEVIRGLWAADERRMLKVEGEHHRVVGARRGPAPAHDIPIWLGAYKPRMLRLVGTAADGWLPSMAYLKEGDLARGNAAIDEAALAAGRDPSDVRRLVNLAGPEDATDQWIDQLVRLALEEGIGTFILAGDDPRAIARFGQEVAPAVREIVAAARAAAGTPPAALRRGATAVAQRRAGIDYEGLPASLAMSGSQAALDALWDTEMAPHADGLYLSFDTDTRPERLADAFPGETLTRLRRLKARWDPDNVFRSNFPIPPALGEPSVDPSTGPSSAPDLRPALTM